MEPAVFDSSAPSPGLLSRKPGWLRVRFPGGDVWKQVDDTLARRGLYTVCNEARCPNKAECWGMGTAAFMILGDLCTRGCRFCAVATAKEGRPVREDEGEALAAAVKELALDYAVLTSVDRDDLPDRGSSHFARCIRAVKESAAVEALIPDYYGEELEQVVKAGPAVIAHNVETVRSLQLAVRDRRADFDKSLRTLREASFLAERFPGPSAGRKLLTKSSILLGLGETEAELYAAMDELRAAGVDILVLGQYLQPTKNQIPAADYITPETFVRWGEAARERGFASVISAPLARTSYHARTVQTTGAKHLSHPWY